MTIIMQDTDLSTVLTVDLAPPCEGKPRCDHTATWAVKVTNTVCGCCFTFLVCGPHKDEVLEQMKDPEKKFWLCVRCGVKWGPSAYADDLILEVEKL